MTLRRFPWGLTVTVLIALAILVALGVWQLQRLEWKEGVLARRAAVEGAPARPLAEVLTASADPAALDMTRVTVTCPGIAKAPFEALYSLANGAVVTRLISACRMDQGPYENILVDRGRVAETISARPLVDPLDTTPLTLTGVLRQPPEQNAIARLVTPAPAPPKAGEHHLWMTYDLQGIGKALGVGPVAPVFIAAETSSNPEWKALTPGLSAEEIPNNHLQYAFTWLSLAGVLLSIYAAMLRKRLKNS